MPIVSSTHILGHLQVDGRRYVIESHTDNVGVVHSLEYLAAIGADYVSAMTARAAQISSQLEAAEIAANAAEVLA